jgi:glycine/D-amino acid oxidase-like deaminating enzyme
MVTTWMIEELLPVAWQAYSDIGRLLDITAISQKNIIDFFPTPQMLEAFKKRLEEGGPFLHSFPEQNHFNPFFNYDFGCGEIRPVYTAHMETLLPAWRSFLNAAGVLVEEDFDIQDLLIKETEIQYRHIRARNIIFCDGAAGFDNPFFNLLPFAPNKGEALTVAIPDLPDHYVYKKGMLLVPLAKPGLFWCGSGYEWSFTDTRPTKKFRESAERVLKEWLKVPFTIVDHKSSIRPATLERRPFVGFHPLHKNIGILSGMGTKGCSLAPYFAKQLTELLVNGVALRADADIARFHKILARN